MVADLQQMKYNIILAHPERYTFIQEDPELAYYLAERGYVLQVNKGSVLGEFGKKCREMANPDECGRDCTGDCVGCT